MKETISIQKTFKKNLKFPEEINFFKKLRKKSMSCNYNILTISNFILSPEFNSFSSIGILKSFRQIVIF